MNRSPAASIWASGFCPCKISKPLVRARLFGFGSGSGLGKLRKCRVRRRFGFAVSAELSKALSFNVGLDSQSNEQSQLPWIGPVPGDIAEIEAYCRIFRAAEQLHGSLMDTLCNPLTGECSVYYDFPSEEKPLLEDKIVAVLGCMLSLLTKGREDVLSGRSSVMSSFRIADSSAMEDRVPPLAVFRSEMKRCCETLHVALENYLTDDNRSYIVWRRLQRLKNVCYDSGFPRRDDHPCHSLFANWSPVYASLNKEDIASGNYPAVFWKGGQVTEEGLKWLVEKGYKAIVDLRAETVKDTFYQAALDDAILSGEIELIKIPVEVGTAPSMEQVEKFASLVADCSKRPIYLHSKEGVRRTSAMVSRWRQYMTHFASQFVSNQSMKANDTLLPDTSQSMGMPTSSAVEERTLPVNESKPLEVVAGETHGSNGVFYEEVSLEKDENLKSLSIDEVHNELASVDGSISAGTIDNGAGFFYRETDPLKAQSPPCNVFSKAEMSRFFRNRKVSPPTYSSYQFKRLEMLPVSREMHIGKNQRNEVVDPKCSPGVPGAGSSNGNLSVRFKTSYSNPQRSQPAKGSYRDGNGNVVNSPNGNIFLEGEKNFLNDVNVPTFASNNLNERETSNFLSKDPNGNSGISGTSSDDEGSVEGNMCASATGVVRLQSRKKAEMFLVRTDGFSCTREKVTESSLAFTHPSTQQQMLMWKSTPKTVLLLKKLGQELMEEAKEVASFLYHQEKMNVLVEPDVHDIFARIPGFGFVQTFYSQDTSDLHERVDLVACLGGDGVILHASNLFRGAVPPVVSFNLGSLGFLTSHHFEEYRQDLRQVIHGNNTVDGVYITLRMRLRCEIFRNGKAVPGKIFDVLNEVVVDRGSNPYLSKIECYEHDRLITKVQGDGVIIATPTGSTAYSTAAGGSMVHPNVPCMLFTPICPHSLSFRPVILPDSARLELKIPEDARSNAWVSFDGKRRQQLSRGHSVQIYMSEHPLPTINKRDQTGDWFRSLIRCLNWNERLDQKAL
ncbi:NAD kinase 2, chloroplastic isoform X2 [Tripterygium wilfordii]|uniref:NAD kinase 2, chloroplastic isoform X2 n=1 Tax=Tripterygium wilfordii TaxID=458696 RepID=UPI0018F842C1|nr:NAD kinase 2, chloroplastic isoform X2 [Tripterygium wilfordii]